MRQTLVRFDVATGRVTAALETDADAMVPAQHWDVTALLASGAPLGHLRLVDGAVVVDAPTPAARPKHLSRLAFLHRFTFAERAALRAATPLDAVVADWWTQFELADFIDLDDPLVAAGLAYLVSANYLAAGRPAVILSWGGGRDE